MNTTTATITRTIKTTAVATTQAELLAIMSFGAPELVTEEFADARALEYVMASGCCATCMVDGEDIYATPEELAGFEACPTCGVRSAEWMLTKEIDARVEALAAVVALDAAVQQA